MERKAGIRIKTVLFLLKIHMLLFQAFMQRQMTYREMTWPSLQAFVYGITDIACIQVKINSN